MVDVAEKKPTCTADGYTKHKACKDCDYTEGKTIIPATGHKDKDGTFTDCNRKGRTCLNNCNLGKDKSPLHLQTTNTLRKQRMFSQLARQQVTQ